MAWQLLAAALPAAAKIAGTALSKPRQEDYAPQTDYMKKYLSYIRGRSSDREVMHQAMQPALRVAGKQGRQMQRQVGYDVAKSGLGGSGIEAQMRLSAGQQTQEALATATDKAVAAQTAETARIGQQAAGITAQIGAEEARAKQAFESAESQWKRQLASDVIGAGASLASAGISQYGENIAGFRQAVMDESIPAGTTYSQFKDMAKGGVIEGAPELGIQRAELGSMSPAEYAQYSGASKQQISGLKLAEEMVGTQKVLDMRKRGISDADIISDAKRMQSMYVSAVGAGEDPVLIRQAMQMGGFGSQTVRSVPEGDNFETAFEKGDKGMIDATDALLTEQQSKSAEAELAEAKKLSAAAKKVIKGGVPKTGKTETPYVGQKVIDGVKYNVNAEGVPVSSYVPETPKKKTGYDWYAESMRKSGREPLSKEEWGAIGNKHKEKHRKVKKPATKVETLKLSRGTVGGEKVPDVSIPLGKTPAQIAKILKYDKALLKQFELFNDEYGLSDEDLKELKKIIESNETLASAG